MCNVRSIGAAAAAVFFIATTGATAGGPPWLKIVNNGQTMPNSTKKKRYATNFSVIRVVHFRVIRMACASCFYHQLAMIEK